MSTWQLVDAPSRDGSGHVIAQKFLGTDWVHGDVTAIIQIPHCCPRTAVVFQSVYDGYEVAAKWTHDDPGLPEWLGGKGEDKQLCEHLERMVAQHRLDTAAEGCPTWGGGNALPLMTTATTTATATTTGSLAGIYARHSPSR